ncbi:MAG: energy-coupling factor transporter ATPase [Firmicutes bacterium]|nr:energy-coupling factor transporter ATPase [Bacillota bacterium]
MLILKCYNLFVGYITFDNVFYSYNAGFEDEVEALRGVSFNIEKGEFVAICGHNGSGKSTIARLMNGLLQPQQGIVTVDGMNTLKPKNSFEIRKRVGLVFQNPDNQMVASIIEDDVAFGPENLGLARSEIEERVVWALESVGMSEYRKGTPFRLSGGQKQRIAIAGVLALKPDVLVLDESTAMLDPMGRKEILQVAKRLQKEERMSVVLITHFLEEALLADKVIVLNQGQIALTGGTEVLSKADILEPLGLDVPFASKVANLLNLREGIVNREELVEEIERLCR